MASKSESRRINLYINGKEVQNNIKSIRQEYLKATSQLNRMTIGSKEYHEQVKKIKYLKNAMNDHNKTLGRTSRAWSNFKRNIGGWIATGFGLAAAGRIFSSFTNNIKNFEKAADNLSAITGLMGEELDYLKDKALGLNKEMKDSGIYIKETAVDILEAYKIVGSAKPELLKNKEALAEVTKQAIILSNAAGMDLTSAVDALTLSMNQFNAPASDAARFANALAAGSKEGAAEIPQLTQAIKEFGPVARSANVSLEQSVALVEALAEKGFKGNRAGIGVRNFLLELQTGADETNPKVVGLDKALENLAAQNLTAADLTKQFGKENVVAAQILIETRLRVEELTEAVSGTNTAYEQASTNTDNLSSRIETLAGTWSSFILRLEDGEGVLAKAIKAVVDFADSAVDEWSRWAQSDDQEAFAKKLKAQQDFIKKFKEHNKLGQEDIEAEWNEKRQGQLKAFELFGEHYDSEQVAQMNKELANIYEHINLIKQAKAEAALESLNEDGDGEEEAEGTEYTQRDQDYLEKMEMLAADEVAIQDAKLQTMEERHSDYASAISEKEKWLTRERQNEIRAFGIAAMNSADALVNFNIAAMNKELAAAGDNEAERDRIRREYAKKNQNLAVTQARIAGAMAIMNIWAGQITSNPLVDTILKALLTAAQIVQTESQVAVIKSQTFEKGGYTDGATNYIAGEAGREYIAPNWQLEHPVYGPIIEDLNQARLGSAPVASNTSNVTNNYGSDNSEMSGKMDTLIELLSDPENRRAYFSRDDLTRFDDEVDELKALANVA